jgi:hypothetical protein
MQDFTVAIIRTNKITYSLMEMTQSRFQKDKLEDDIEEYVEIVEMKNSEMMMDTIIETLGMTKDIMGTTTICYQDNEYVYEMSHLIDDIDKTQKQNNICIRFAKHYFRVVGDAVLMKSRIMPDLTTEPCSITMDDILNLYQNCLIRTCVKIDTTGDIDDIKYVFNPIDWMKPTIVENIRVHEKKFHDNIMLFFIELVPQNNILNEKASILYGKVIYGDVIIAMRDEPTDIRHTEHEYYNIDKILINKCVALYSVPKETLNISLPEKKTKTQIKNFHVILDKKYNMYKTLYKKKYSDELLKDFDKIESLNKISIDMINKTKKD